MDPQQQALLAGDFVLGLILGILFGLFLVVVFYVAPHLWWAWHHRPPRVTVDQLLAEDFDDHTDQAIANTVEREATS